MEDSGGNTTTSSFEDGGGPTTIKIKIFHGSNHYDLTVPSQSTFEKHLLMDASRKTKNGKGREYQNQSVKVDGVSIEGDLKRVIAEETGLDPKVQNLLFRGKGKEDHEYLHSAGLKDNAKVIVMENSAVEERIVEEVKESSEVSRGCEAVAEVRGEIDQLAEQVAALETVVCAGTQVVEKDIIFLTEMLMRQLLKLDSIDAEGEGKVQRKMEVRRIQSLVETVDNLKARNSNPVSNISNSVLDTAQSESVVESANPAPPLPSSTKVTEEWEVFE